MTAPKAFRTPENIFAATSKRGRKNSRQPARRVASGPHHRDPPTAPSVLRAIASGSVDMWSGDARQRMRALTARARSGCGGGCDPGVIRVWCGCGAGVVDCGKPPTGRRDGSIGIEGVAGSRGAGSRPLERPNLRESSVIPRFGPRRHTPHPARLPRRTNPRKLAVNEGVAQSVEHRPFKTRPRNRTPHRPIRPVFPEGNAVLALKPVLNGKRLLAPVRARLRAKTPGMSEIGDDGFGA